MFLEVCSSFQAKTKDAHAYLHDLEDGTVLGGDTGSDEYGRISEFT